jgi:hypoxia up-regulated 1
VTTEDARDTFRSQLTDMEDWLYMDPEAETAGADILRAKLKTLTAVGDPIKMRAYELQRRPERVDGAQSIIVMVEMSTNSWPDTRQWLDVAQIQELRQLVRQLNHAIQDVCLASGGLRACC